MITPDKINDLVLAVAQHRDRFAFEQLFDYFAPRLTSYLLKIGSDLTLAEEITQETMVTLWRKADQFDPSKAALSTWLYRVARNRRIDVLRKVRVDFLDPNEPAFQPSKIINPDVMLDGQQRDEAVRHAMDILPDEQLSLVRLAFFDGLSHQDISAKTGIPLGTVKSRIRLAFTRLRRNLEQAGIVDASQN